MSNNAMSVSPIETTTIGAITRWKLRPAALAAVISKWRVIDDTVNTAARKQATGNAISAL